MYAVLTLNYLHYFCVKRFTFDKGTLSPTKIVHGCQTTGRQILGSLQLVHNFEAVHRATTFARYDMTMWEVATLRKLS